MYPRFIQKFLDKQLDRLPTHKEKYDAPFHNKKVFANMKRIGKGFSGKETPLLPTMVGPSQVQMGEVADEAVYKKGGDRLGKATTTASSLEAEHKVLDLEYELKMTKTYQQTKIESLEKRVKKLEKKNMSRTHKLKRLYKVGLTARVEESSDDDVLDKEDASKQGRIETIDADEDIALVSTHKENVSSMHGDDMVEDVVKEEVVKDIITAKLIPEVVSTAATKTVETTQAPKVRGISIQEQEESATRTLSSQPQVQDKSKGKAKMIEPKHVKSLEKRTLKKIRMDEELATKLETKIRERNSLLQRGLKQKGTNHQPKLNKEGSCLLTLRTWKHAGLLAVKGKKEKKYKEGSEKRAGEEPMSKQSKKQKVSDDKDNAELYKLIEIIPKVEEVAIHVVPLAVKTPIVSWKIVKEGKMSYYQIFRAGGKSQRYLNMFKPNVEESTWRRHDGHKVLEWRLYNNCRVHFMRMQSCQLYMLVEKKYPLTTPTLTMMLDKTLKADHLNEMACKLFKFTLKQIPGAYEAFKKEASKDE
nr:hypothetical protein [Tanacetum cinerariifolium]